MAASIRENAKTGQEAVVSDLQGRYEDIMYRLPTVSVERAREWTTHIAALDDHGKSDWRTRYLRLFDDLMRHGRQMSEGQFMAWKLSMPEQWDSTVYNATRNHFRLVSLRNHEFPDTGSEFFWTREQAMYVKELAFEGNSMIIFGPKGSGKTGRAVWTCEAIDRLKREQIEQGSRSLFAQIRRRQNRRNFEIAGQEVKRLGLWDAKDIRFVANFSISDRVRDSSNWYRSPKYCCRTALPREEMVLHLELEHGLGSEEATSSIAVEKNIPSPIKAKWYRCERVSDTLTQTANFLEAGYYTVVVIDEAGLAWDRNRTTSKKVTALKGYAGFTRKLNQGLLLITHHEKTDLPDEVVEDASTKVTLIRPGDGSPPKRGIMTIPGVMKDGRVRDIPEPISAYDTEEFPALIVDVDISAVVESVAQAQGNAERAKEEWGRTQRARAIRDAVSKLKATAADIAAGRSAAQISEVRFMLTRMPVGPAGRPWTTEEIVSVTGADAQLIDSIRRSVEGEAQRRASSIPAR